MVDNASQYLPEAIAYAHDEITRRGGRSALLQEIASSRDAEIARGIAERQEWERLPCGGLFSTEGRYSRARYFCTIFAASGVMYVLYVIIVAAGGSADFGCFVWLTVVLPITLVAVVKRFHDINRPGSDVLGLLIPFYNIYLGLILLCREGTEGANQYGPDPLAQKQRGD